MILQVLNTKHKKHCKITGINGSMGDVRLEDILDKKHGLYQLANRLNWDYLIKELGSFYAEGPGRPEIPIRVIAGLHYLKYLENESDEGVIEKFCENPYWQYFCGMETFQHEIPCHPTTLVKWRKRIGEKGIEKLLSHTIDTAKREGLLPEKLIKNVNVDTTVQEKAITFPTDTKLCHRMRIKLISASKKRGIILRQTYIRVGKKSCIMQARYAHAKQMKRAQKEFKKVRCYLGRVTRDIERKADLSNDPELTLLLSQANQLLKQKKNTPNKLYSLHAPEVECIAKGKIHKRYEFGCKVSIVTTSNNPWVLSVLAHHGNPYDGSTLKESLQKAEEISSGKIEQAFVDKGYRGKEHHPEDKKVYIPGKKSLPVGLKKLLKGRSGIEPIISHLKHDHRLDRNYLLGTVGDKINAVLAGCGFNLKKILNWIKIEQMSTA
jgi:IS5 family transposase